MKTLAKSHVCNHCVISKKKKKHLKICLLCPVSYRDFQETAQCSVMLCKCSLTKRSLLLEVC